MLCLLSTFTPHIPASCPPPQAPANVEHDAMLDRFAVVHWLRDTFNTLGQDALSTLGLTSDLTPALRSSK